MAQETFELIEAEGARYERVQRAMEERRRVLPRGQGGAGAGQMDRIEAPRAVRHDGVAFEVPFVEGLQRMFEHDGVAGAAGRRPHGVLHHVEQLTDGDGGRPAEIGALVAARVRDDEVVLRRQQCIQ